MAAKVTVGDFSSGEVFIYGGTYQLVVSQGSHRLVRDREGSVIAVNVDTGLVNEFAPDVTVVSAVPGKVKQVEFSS